jgi:SNF2 family DNA or RNA helicase
MKDYKLEPYQKEAVKFALNRHKSALLLPTGAGKTICSLLYLKVLDKPAVIIAPAPIINKRVWQEENAKFGVGVDITTDCRTYGKVLLVSYDWVKNNVEALADYQVIVLDEAHCIADTETERYKNLSEVIKAKERVLLLAGYPVENKMNEIYMLSLITDALGSNYFSFLYRHFTVIKHHNHIIRTIPKKGSFEQILEKIKDVVYIVDKEKVVPKSVKKETLILRYKLSDYQRGMINALQEFGEYQDERVHIVVKNQLAAYSKIMQIVDNFVYVPDTTKTSKIIDEDEKIPVFPVYFDDPNPKVEALRGALKGKSNYLLWFMFDTGYEMLSDFSGNGRLCKMQTDSRGLNLQAYDFAIWFDVPLSGGMFLQGVDRLHRMGRTKDVISVVLIPEGEFGTRLLQMLDGKQKLTKKFIKGLLSVKV